MLTGVSEIFTTILAADRNLYCGLLNQDGSPSTITAAVAYVRW